MNRIFRTTSHGLGIRIQTSSLGNQQPEEKSLISHPCVEINLLRMMIWLLLTPVNEVICRATTALHPN